MQKGKFDDGDVSIVENDIVEDIVENCLLNARNDSIATKLK